MASYFVIVAFCAMLFAYLYGEWQEKYGPAVDHFSLALDRIISHPSTPVSRVAVGVNGDVDLIVSGIELLQALNISPGSQVDHVQLHTLEQLQETFHLQFAKGAGCERFFADRELFDEIVETAQNLPSAEWYIGGNAALISQKIASTYPDINVLLCGPIGPVLKAMFHENIIVPQQCQHAIDEVHLIMQFTVGETWGHTRSPVATRFIISHDLSNAKQEGLSALTSILPDFKPNILVLSGLHLLDGFTKDIWQPRLETFSAEVQQIHSNIPVHLEMATMGNADIVCAIAEQILPQVHSIGLNEQELMFLSRACGGPHQNEDITGGYPEFGVISDALDWLLTKYGVNSPLYPHSKLSRVHFHCLVYHVLVVSPDTWRKSESAVAAGTQTAGTQACNCETLQRDKMRIRMEKAFPLSVSDSKLRRTVILFDAENPITTWLRNGFLYHLCPVPVCNMPLKTVGLGDAVSATGLIYSSFEHTI